jgi:hypothetical protein
LQHLDLVLVQSHDRAVADDVHVGGDCFGEDVALGRPEVSAAGQHPLVGGADRIADPAAAEQRVADVDPGVEVAAVAAAGAGQVLVHAGRGRNLRPTQRARDRHAFVQRPELRTLTGNGRVRSIGLDQRLAQRVRLRCTPDSQGCDSRGRK